MFIFRTTFLLVPVEGLEWGSYLTFDNSHIKNIKTLPFGGYVYNGQIYL